MNIQTTDKQPKPKKTTPPEECVFILSLPGVALKIIRAPARWLPFDLRVKIDPLFNVAYKITFFISPYIYGATAIIVPELISVLVSSFKDFVVFCCCYMCLNSIRL